MAGDENPPAFSRGRRRNVPLRGENGIDPGVSRDVDFAWDAFRAKVGSGRCGWREQQIRLRIDRGAIFFLRPRKLRVVCPEAGFDMSDRQPGGKARERRPERA
jgi:hypothetical protein